MLIFLAGPIISPFPEKEETFQRNVTPLRMTFAGGSVGESPQVAAKM